MDDELIKELLKEREVKKEVIINKKTIYNINNEEQLKEIIDCSSDIEHIIGGMKHSDRLLNEEPLTSIIKEDGELIL